MQTKYKKQSGFTIVETLLVLVVIGLISGVCFYLYSTKTKNDDATLQNSNNSTSSNVESKDQTKPVVKYLEVKEWGVKLPVYDDKYSDLYYTDLSKFDKTAYTGAAERITLTSTTLRKIHCEGTDTYPSIFYDAKIYRTTDKDAQWGGGNVVPRKQPIDGYYYTFVTGGGGMDCNISDSDMQILKSLDMDKAYQAAFEGIVKS